MDDSRYSFSLTTFSPSGKLVQINYALNAVAQGSTSLGIKGKLMPLIYSIYLCTIMASSGNKTASKK
jgi:hypothetical protein